jgi:hypothetical protein
MNQRNPTPSASTKAAQSKNVDQPTRHSSGRGPRADGCVMEGTAAAPSSVLDRTVDISRLVHLRNHIAKSGGAVAT